MASLMMDPSLQQQPLPMPTGMSQTNTGNPYNLYEINKVVGTVLETFFNMIPIAAYCVSLIIVFLSFVNVILYIGIVIYYFVKSNTDTTIKDTMKYKQLAYIDIMAQYVDVNVFSSMFSPASTKNIKEPFFYIYAMNYCIVVILAMYIVLLIVYVLCFIVVMFFKVLVPLLLPNLKIDSIDQENGNMFSKHTSDVYVFIGFAFAVLLLLIYKIYFNNTIYPILNDIKYNVVMIDKFIKESLSKGGSKIDENLYNILKSKGKQNLNGEYEEVNALVMKNISDGKIEKATQNLLFFTLYSHLYDQIPETNKSSIEMIKYYFFKDPKGENFDLNKPDEYNQLSYISLMVDSKGITQVPRVYEVLEVYKSKDPGAKKAISDLNIIITQLDDMLQSMPELKNTSILFGIYIVCMAIFCTLFIVFFNFIIIKKEEYANRTQGSNKTLSVVASGINGVMVYSFPQLGELFLSIIYSKENTICKSLSNNDDEKNQYRGNYAQCMADKINYSLQQLPMQQPIP